MVTERDGASSSSRSLSVSATEREQSPSPLWATEPSAVRRHRLEAVEAVGERLGTPLMPWQRQVARVVTEEDGEGFPSWPDTLVLTPRQSGKTTLVACLMVEEAERNPGARIAYTAQTRTAGARRLLDIGSTLVRAGDDVKVTRGMGNERLLWPNGSEAYVLAPNAVGGHGESLDLVVLDEAWAVERLVLEGIVPARAARPRSRMVAISTMGTTDSELLLDLIAQGEEGSIAYFRWSAPDDVDIMDDEALATFHPAVGRTIHVRSIAAARSVLKPNEYRRAYLNQLVEVDTEDIPRQWWESSARPNVSRPERGLVLAVDIGVGPDTAAIAAAWSPEDGEDWTHGELIDWRPGSPTWITSRLEELFARYRPEGVVIDAIGPAALVAEDVRDVAERHRVDVRVPTSREVATGSSVFLDGLRNGTVTHGVADPLELAVRGARRKTFGDDWVWSRRKSVHDVTPLIAVALATWNAVERRRRPRVRPVIM